jgi:predicted transcriptional regulator
MTVSSPTPQQTNGSKPVTRKPTRQVQLRKLLSRKSGATVAQIQKAFGWQPHTVRAAISSQRKAGCVIARSDTDTGSVYRIVDEGCDP